MLSTFCILVMTLGFHKVVAADSSGLKASADLMNSLKEANRMWINGDATNGIPKYEGLLREIETAYGSNSPFAGLILFRIGFFHANRDDFERALPYLERSLKIINPLPNNEQNLETKANLCWGLGTIYKALLKTELAIKAFNQSLMLKEKLAGNDDPGFIDILIEVANLHCAQQQPLEAILPLERALSISEKKFGLESKEAAKTLASLGNTRALAGQFEPAIDCLKRSLEIRERILSPTNTDVAVSLYNLGSLYVEHDENERGIPLLGRSVQILEKYHDPGNVVSVFAYTAALNNLGAAQVGTGNCEKGIGLLQQSLKVTESAFGAASINVVNTLNSLAVAFRHHGDFDRAQQSLERALRILEGAPPYKNGERINTLNNLAQLALDRGDEEAALKLFSQSQKTGEYLLGPAELPLAYSLNGLALISQRRGDFHEALDFFERSLAILENKFGPLNQTVASVLSNIASLLEKTGDKTRALSTIQRALAIQEKILPENHPDIALTLNNLASFSVGRGDLANAKLLFRKSLIITDAAIGKDNPDSCARLENLGIVEFLTGDAAKGLGEFVESSRRWRRYLASQMVFQQGTEASRKQQYILSSRDWFHSLCSAAQASFTKAAAYFGAEQLAFSKALLEEIETVKARLTVDNRVQVQALREQAVSLRLQLDEYKHQEITEWAQERYEWRKSKRDRLENDLKATEAKIAAASELVAKTVREGDLTLSEIASGLLPHSALLDFIEYRRTDFTAGNSQWKEHRYAVYLTFPLTGNSTNIVVERVDLGEAAPINDNIALVCRRMSAGQYAAPDLSAALQQLHALVYAPIARYLTNTSHLIICPDGQLSRVPFEILPVGKNFLVEEKTVSYITSGREIARLSKPGKHSGRSRSVVMGNPDFDRSLASPHRSVSDVQLAAAPAVLSPLTRHFDSLKFQPLPGAEAEARSIASILGKDTKLYLGAEAGVAELKSVKSPRVLHLATHGFYFPNQEINLLRRLAAGSGNNNWENPLARCGLAMAGANHAMQITNAQTDNGLVTGLEASLLDLQGTELVILSACDSGTGEVKIGEGVMSLRRAFLIAGAKTVLASHWDISDKATRQLMTEFMRRWQNGEPRAAAWRNAQLSLLHSSNFSNPYFWAAFTLTGQWQ